MAEPRYIIIHGHFYQPPRESPWTGLIAPEPSAAPFPNWNERILSECYNANAHAHMMEGPVVHVRNNYESMNFDFGPTLLALAEAHGKAAYRAMRRGDEAQRKHARRPWQRDRAILQPFDTAAADARDREIQIAWGIEDFVYRLAHRPEGMWLPECAVDDETLASLVAQAGIKFTILAPTRDASWRRCNSREAGPFVWRRDESDASRSSASIASCRARSPSARRCSDGTRFADRVAAVALAHAAGRGGPARDRRRNLRAS